MSFKEHNNREVSKKLAEYITGTELRKYVAKKVKQYVNLENPTVFDGAVGSGQLEQFVNPAILYGVDVQESSIDSARQNFQNTELEVKSFFEYERENFEVDCVIMNPPFSLKFKDLTEQEQKNIQKQFSWKKSGVVDDIFVLKSLEYTKRYAFYILFPGVGYRKTEEKFRELIGNRLTELNVISNAFTDTSIDVLFLVVDKNKTTDDVYRELYEKNLELDLFLIKECDANIDFNGNIRRLKAIVEKYENKFRSKKRCKNEMTLLEKQSKLLTLFSDAQR